jgi:hypothetical protein
MNVHDVYCGLCGGGGGGNASCMLLIPDAHLPLSDCQPLIAVPHPPGRPGPSPACTSPLIDAHALVPLCTASYLASVPQYLIHLDGQGLSSRCVVCAFLLSVHCALVCVGWGDAKTSAVSGRGAWVMYVRDASASASARVQVRVRARAGRAGKACSAPPFACATVRATGRVHVCVLVCVHMHMGLQRCRHMCVVCRLDQLLPLGSLIFKESSGYRAFYHHLLKPHEHYVPFWDKVSVGAVGRLVGC